MQDSRIKMSNLRDDMRSGQVDMGSIREIFQKAFKDTNDKVKAILDDKQKVKYDAYVKERMSGMRNRTGGRRNQNTLILFSLFLLVLSDEAKQIYL